MSKTKARAVRLLKKYDKDREALRKLERELVKATTEYGREQGYWAFRVEHLRIQIENDEQKKEQAA